MPRRSHDESNDEPLPPPAKTDEGREDQLIAATYDLVEKRIHNGTASSTETVHFLKAGSRMMKSQLEKVENENEVLRTRVKEMESRVSSEAMMLEALEAFKGYSGEIAVDLNDSEEWNY